MKDRLFRFRERAHALFGQWLGNDLSILVFGALVGAAGGTVTVLFGTLVESAARLAWGVQEGRGGGAGTRGWVGLLLLVVVPTLGGLLVGFIQNHLAKTGPTHGIPEVVAALAQKRGVIPVKNGLWKAVTASLTLGSGGCAGMEGPVVTIGSAAGSGVGRLIGVRSDDLPVLVGCGAAAAVSAAFGAPIAGVLFVLEVILLDFSPRIFMPIVVASVAGTVASQAVADAFLAGHGTGHGALFLADSLADKHPTLAEAPVYMLLGLLCGLLGLAITFADHHGARLWKRAPGPSWLRPGMGGLLLGLLGVSFALLMRDGDGVLRTLSGQSLPAFMGNGYNIIASLFKPANFGGAGGYTVLLLVAVVLFKILGVGLTLGSGGSGGAIAPSLFVGAAAGGAVGCLAKATGWFPNATPATYALVGMAGVIAGAFRCPLTAFVLVFELTRDYTMILPAMAVAILAVAAARRFQRDSQVALHLRDMGVRTGHGVAILRRAKVDAIPLETPYFVTETDSSARILDLAGETHADDFVVLDGEGRYRGVVYSETLREVLLARETVPMLIVGDLMRADLPTLAPDETLEAVLDKFAESKARSLPMLDGAGRVSGLMTRGKLMMHYHRIMAQD